MTKSYLLDGPLMTTCERRKAVLERMATVLTDSGEGIVTERDAVRVLLAKGFHYIDVAVLADKARTLAFQNIVAREMMEP